MWNKNIWAIEESAFGRITYERQSLERVGLGLSQPAGITVEPRYRLWKPGCLSMRVHQVSDGPAADAERDELPLNMMGGVAMVHLDGPMLKGGGGWLGRLFGMTDTLAVRRAVEAATADPDVKAVLLRVDSPGGSVDGLAELGDAVYAARQAKTIIAQVDGMAASAGYCVASQADAVYAQRTDLVGSIGTRMMLYDWSRAFQNEGIRPVPIDSSPTDRPFKSMGAFGTEITEQQEAEFQRIVDGYFADFRQMVRRGRNMDDARFDAIADGRVWMPADALQLGLIDRVQTVEQTLAELQSGIAEQDGRDRMARAKAKTFGR